MSTKVVTGKIRLSFPELFEPKSFQGQEPKYSTVILIPKSDTKTVESVKAGIAAAQEQGKEKFWSGKLPHNAKNPLRDGDTDKDLDQNPEFAGHYFITASSKNAPRVVDGKLNELFDKSEVFGGQFARVSVNAFAYNHSAAKGVSLGLNNVQILGGGEPFGAVASKPEDDFEALSDDDLLA